MKKFITTLFVVLLCLSFVACDQETSASRKTKKPKATETATVQATASPTPTPEPTPTDVPTATPAENEVLSNDDFTITFPGTWTYEAPAEVGEDGMMLKIFYPNSDSNINMMWIDDTSFKLEQFNEEMGKQMVEAISQQLNIPITYVAVEKDQLGNKEAGGLTYTLTKDGKECVVLQAYVPVEDGLYIITMNIVENKGGEELLKVMNDVEFK